MRMVQWHGGDGQVGHEGADEEGEEGMGVCTDKGEGEDEDEDADEGGVRVQRAWMGVQRAQRVQCGCRGCG